ncbi:MAG TPA: PAS domain S-box protein [Syntrophomonadaceae bacterium]|nr:PAS domain S-box protein [Syntrophomonadaceae bacterium]
MTEDGKEQKDRQDDQSVQEMVQNLNQMARTYLDIAAVVLVGFDRQLNVFFINRKGCQVMGCREDELIGRCWMDIYPPEPLREKMKSYFRRVIDGEQTLREYYEGPLIDGNGQTRIIAWHNSLLYDDKERVVGVISAGEDITETRLAQREAAREKERLDVTLKSIGDAVISIDSEGYIQIMNPMAEMITGWYMDETRGKLISQVLQAASDDEQRILLTMVQDLLAPGKAQRLSGEMTIISRLGDKKIIAYTAAPIQDETSEQSGHVLVFRDVSQVKINQTRLALSQKLESIGQLAAGIAHEINNPMQFISDNTEFFARSFAVWQELQEDYEKLTTEVEKGQVDQRQLALIKEKRKSMDLDYLKEEIPRAIQENMEGIQRVKKIIMAMKDFSHPGQKEVLADINHAIEITVTLSKNTWKYNADVTSDLDPQLPSIYCTIDEIKQVILNLIVNASDAIQEAIEKGLLKKGIIRIRSAVQDGFVVITIADNGVGIEPAHLDRIFDLFFTTKEVGKGTGQGLSIAYDIIVNKHRGSIDVKSQPGQGAVFTIRLPLRTQAESK